MCRVSKLCILFLSVVLIAGMAGCVQSSPSGKWVKSKAGGLPFENRTIVPDYTYYFIGNEVTPESIIAIDNKYTLRSRAWVKVDISQKILDDWMFWIDTRLSLSCSYHSGVINTPDGETVGIWYSRKLISVVKILEPGVLQIYAPYNPSGSLCAKQERWDER